MVKSWIINSVSREIATSVMCLKTAKEVWKDINERFGQSNGSKYLQIQRKISTIVQGSPDIANYFTKLRTLWDELNSSYVGPTYESQREAPHTPSFSGDSASFLASPTSFNNNNMNFTQKVNFDSKRNANSVSCKYCKKTGHIVDKCYRLYGFPVDFRFTKNKKLASCVQTEVPYVPSSCFSAASSDSSIHCFTKEQYQHLLSMFQHVQLSSGMSPGASSTEDSTFAHFAGLFSAYAADYPTSHAYASTHLGMQPWILDSGATNYMTPYKHLLQNLTPLPKHFLVTLPNGYKGPSLKRPLVIGKAAGRLYYLHPGANLFPSSLTASIVQPSSISDNAFELDSSTEATNFFGNEGILHQRTIPHTPQQNGVVERKYKHFLEVARALLFQSKLSLKFWGECILTATYLINKMSSPLLLNVSPYEKLHGNPPIYEHLKSFGCLCFATSLKRCSVP
ncbi:uncharacterized protein [Nicotiana sylvestris]|uniref:uncharacterized protein n=1 Tax=Nicotiana sylvestris TaxID=4096 RepID=UPI00388C5607